MLKIKDDVDLEKLTFKETKKLINSLKNEINELSEIIKNLEYRLEKAKIKINVDFIEYTNCDLKNHLIICKTIPEFKYFEVVN